MIKYCFNCGKKLTDEDNVCSNCGSIVDGSDILKYEVKENTNNIQTNNEQNIKETNGVAIAGFVVTLVSTFLCCGIFNFVGLVLSIIGLVKSKELDGSGKGIAIAGIGITVILIVIIIILIYFRKYFDTIRYENLYS